MTPTRFLCILSATLVGLAGFCYYKHCTYKPKK